VNEESQTYSHIICIGLNVQGHLRELCARFIFLFLRLRIPLLSCPEDCTPGLHSLGHIRRLRES